MRKLIKLLDRYEDNDLLLFAIIVACVGVGICLNHLLWMLIELI